MSREKCIVVTGAGSGIGKSIALRFARENWKVAIVGRRPAPLEATAAEAGPQCQAFPCDVSVYTEVERTISDILECIGRVDALVNCAGVNIPERSWTDITADQFAKVVSINLQGPFHCVKACLEELRKRQGTIVNVNSEAGRRATAKAGCAYVAAKYGLAGLTESLNAEERLKGLRSISIFPGEVNTSLLDQRPSPPPREARRRMVQPENVAETVWMAVSLPANALIEELVIRPTETDYQ